MKKSKVPPKLSTQEGLVYRALQFGKTVTVFQLYRIAKQTTHKQAEKKSARRRQQHVGVIVQRLNKKRRRTIIKPGPRHEGGHSTYAIRRRR